MRKRYRKAITAAILACVLTLIIGGNTVLYAFFQAAGGEGSVTASSSLADSTAGVVIVANESELIAEVTDGKANLQEKTSAARRTVRFSGDIYLSRCFNITADVNIDLNGHTLFTCGYRINVRHYYYGAFDFYGGKVSGEASGEQIRIFTPNAYVSTDLTLENIEIFVAAFDKESLFDSVFSAIADKIAGGGRFTSISQGGSLNKNRYCARHASTGGDNDCAYVSEDLDLPLGYGGFDMTIEYMSSDESVLNNYGEVGGGLTGIRDVILTAKLEYGGVTKSKDFALHVYSKFDISAVETAAACAFVERLEAYYFVGTLEGHGEVSLYYIPESVSVGSVSLLNGAKLVYKTLASDGKIIDSTDANTEENFVAANNGEWTMTLNDEVTELVVSGASGGAEIRIPVNGQTSQNINDNYSKAIKIARKLYGDELIITSEARDAELGTADGREYVNGYRSYALEQNANLFSGDGVIGISYSLVNDADAVYSILGGKLSVANADYPPTVIHSANLCMRFEFSSEPQVVKINIPIKYDSQKTGDGNNIEQFLPYYNFFDRILLARTNGYTYRDFKMPLGHGVRGAIYYYEPYFADGSAADSLITFKLAYSLQGTDFVKTRAEAEALDAATLKEIMMSGTANWLASFDIDALPLNDTEIVLRYRYKFYGYDSVWYGANEPYYESRLTVTGVIKPKVAVTDIAAQDNVVTDANLYKYMYDCARPNKLTAEYTSGSSEFIETHWLDGDFINLSGESKIDLSGKVINDSGQKTDKAAVTNFDGLRFIGSVDTLNLSSAGITVSDIAFVSEIGGIRELNLADNGLSDRSKSALGFPSGSDNGIFTKLSLIGGLKRLHLENNAFFYFSGLTKLPELTEVCVFGNVSSGVLSSFINAIYGTDGMVNYSAYNRLTAKHVTIRNVSETAAYNPVGSSDLMDKLESLAYQRVLNKGESIKHAYDGLPTDPSYYGIANMSSSFWGTTAKDTLEFGFYGNEFETSSFYALFKYRVTTGILSTEWVEIFVDFEVERL